MKMQKKTGIICNKTVLLYVKKKAIKITEKTKKHDCEIVVYFCL